MKYNKVVFSLDKKSPVELETEIDNKTVKIFLDKNQLVVENIETQSEDDAIKYVRKIAEQFLNWFSWKYDIGVVIDSSSIQTEHIDSSTGIKHKGIYITETAIVSEKVSIKKFDTYGNLIYDSEKPGFVTMISLEAAAYFRKGIISKDPFDKFRNFYLVAENISSQISKKFGLSITLEQPLLENALNECFKNNISDLENETKFVKEFMPAGNIISEVAKFLYKTNRCALNHSKVNQNKKIPFNAKDEAEVENALPLMKYVAKSMLQYAENSNLK